MADPLSILFGSTARVKLLRFFLFNPSKEFTFDDISRRARLVRRTARTEISALEKAGVIVRRTLYVPIDGKTKKMKALGFALNKNFEELPVRKIINFMKDNQRNLQKLIKNAEVPQSMQARWSYTNLPEAWNRSQSRHPEFR